MQQATTTSLQSSDVVVDLGWAIVSVLDLGLGEKKKRAGNERSLLNGGVRSRSTAGREKKRAGNERNLLNGGESGNEANSMERE
ncbi:hypothetical protein WN943_023553 [Citrus x changshan-huyou]